jgi:N-acyl-D-amino-acid deacylase
MLDLLVSNGLVIDGSGSPGFHASVGIEGNTVRILRGEVASDAAQRIIDATNLVVAPGFIDMHAHSGLVMLDEPLHEPKVRQGVTTEVIGVDGNSYAPFRSPDDFDSFVELNSGLDGDPPLTRRWSTVDEYLRMFDRKVAVNVAYLVGNSPLRINTVGWGNRRANARELEDMKAILREAMAEGAFGLSTGLDYPPGSYADTDELVALSTTAASLGGIYHTHVRYSLGDSFLDPFREALDIGRRSEIPVHITHFYQRVPVRGSSRQLIDLVDTARHGGLDVTFDSYPYNLSSTRLLIILPQWAHDGGPQQLKDVLRSHEMRSHLRDEVVPTGGAWQDMWLTNFRNAQNHGFEGRSIAEVSAMLCKGEVDTVCDLLLDEDLRVCFVTPSANGTTLHRFVSHPAGMVGSDSIFLGDFPSPRTYGTFPIILGEFVRMEGYLSLPEAVRKMTSFPAQRLGISDRGLLRDGMRADVVVFDPDTVSAPASRRNPKQFAVGIEYVIVNGQVVVERGRHSGALAGRALRRGRPSAT